MQYKQRTFEDFLGDWHAENYHGTDDDMPDAFDTWLGELDGEDYIKYAELYGQEQYIAGKQEILK